MNKEPQDFLIAIIKEFSNAKTVVEKTEVIAKLNMLKTIDPILRGIISFLIGTINQLDTRISENETDISTNQENIETNADNIESIDE